MGTLRMTAGVGIVTVTEVANDQIVITVNTKGKTWDETTVDEIESRLHDSVEETLLRFW